MTTKDQTARIAEDVQQAARILREWAGDRQRGQGKWTAREQAAIECALRLEAAADLLTAQQETHEKTLESFRKERDRWEKASEVALVAMRKELEKRRVDIVELSAALDSVIEERDKADEEVKALQQELREEWWSNHGCPPGGRYGDDGEMQCNQAGCMIDFKRMPFNELRDRVNQKRLERIGEAWKLIQSQVNHDVRDIVRRFDPSIPALPCPHVSRTPYRNDRDEPDIQSRCVQCGEKLTLPPTRAWE